MGNERRYSFSRLLNVDNNGHMIIKCCNRDNNAKEEEVTSVKYI